MSKVVDACQGLISEIVQGLGYELVEVEYAKKVDGMNLTITIDKENGVNIDDCEIVHKAIDEPLDALDPTGGSTYTLNVSSPGIDRPVKTERDFVRSKGKCVEVTLYASMLKKKKFVGTLIDFNETSITIEIDPSTKKKPQPKQILEIEREKIASIVPHITF